MWFLTEELSRVKNRRITLQSIDRYIHGLCRVLLVYVTFFLDLDRILILMICTFNKITTVSNLLWWVFFYYSYSFSLSVTLLSIFSLSLLSIFSCFFFIKSLFIWLWNCLVFCWYLAILSCRRSSSTKLCYLRMKKFVKGMWSSKPWDIGAFFTLKIILNFDICWFAGWFRDFVKKYWYCEVIRTNIHTMLYWDTFLCFIVTQENFME